MQTQMQDLDKRALDRHITREQDTGEGISEARLTHLQEVYGPKRVETWEVDLDVATSAGPRALNVRLINTCGPAGGWPIYRFEGTEEAILALLDEFDDGQVRKEGRRQRETRLTPQ
jgi:hypothetical protein